MCVWRFVLTNILALQLGPLKPKFLTPPLSATLYKSTWTWPSKLKGKKSLFRCWFHILLWERVWIRWKRNQGEKKNMNKKTMQMGVTSKHSYNRKKALSQSDSKIIIFFSSNDYPRNYLDIINHVVMFTVRNQPVDLTARLVHNGSLAFII